MSNGFVRGQTSRFRLLDNAAPKGESKSDPKGSQGGGAKAVQSGLVAAISSAKTTGSGSGGATTALKRAAQPEAAEEPRGYAANAPQKDPEVEAQGLPAEALAKAGGENATSTAPDKNALRAEARMKGYEGEACGECGNFTMVRNGTCLKCDTCGSTSGCS